MSEGNTVPRFTLKLKETKVELETTDGEIKEYTIRELDGTKRDGYVQFMLNKMDMGADGTGKMKSADKIQAALLARCLYDSENRAVSESVIQTFPSSTLNALYKIASELSGLDEKAETEAKNA